MMSRVTIDLKKHAKDHIHYDISRHVAPADGEGPYCYQMSRIRFRDIITGGRRVPRPPRTPYESAERRNMANPEAGAVLVVQAVPVNEGYKLMGEP